MKNTLTFNPSIIRSTASKVNVESFDLSVDAFEKKEFKKSFHLLMDYMNPEFRTKYGNEDGSEFNVPHGSILVNIKIDDKNFSLTAPFLSLPEKGKIPLLRQIAELNFVGIDLAKIALNDNNEFLFEYSCPIELINPHKIFYIIEEVCWAGDKYDDEFVTKFDAKRIYEPKVTAYAPALVDYVYNVFQQSCTECFEAVTYFENARKYGYAWSVMACTFYKLLYYANPQGQLLNDLKKAIREHDRENIPTPEVVAASKIVLERIKNTEKEKLAQDLYFIETFATEKRRSNIKNIQENFKDAFTRATSSIGAGDSINCYLTIVYWFYRIYYIYNLQDDINAIIVDAMAQSSNKSFEEAAPILHKAMKRIMSI